MAGIVYELLGSGRLLGPSCVIPAYSDFCHRAVKEGPVRREGWTQVVRSSTSPQRTASNPVLGARVARRPSTRPQSQRPGNLGCRAGHGTRQVATGPYGTLFGLHPLVPRGSGRRPGSTPRPIQGRSLLYQVLIFVSYQFFRLWPPTYGETYPGQA